MQLGQLQIALAMATASESWVGDGIGDCRTQLFGCDLNCYADDGDCAAGRKTASRPAPPGEDEPYSAPKVLTNQNVGA